MLAFHNGTQVANIKHLTLTLTTITLVQFCVSKSRFNVTSLIREQLACNNTEVVYTLNPMFFRSLSITVSYPSHNPNIMQNISTRYLIIQFKLPN